MKKLVLTVCWGNIQRSVIAELCLSRELAKRKFEGKVEVLSRGIQGSCRVPKPKFDNLMWYPKQWQPSEPYLKQIGIEIPNTQRFVPVDEGIIERASLILVAEKGILKVDPNGPHREHPNAGLLTQFPSAAYKMILFTELVDRTDDIEDCGDREDSDSHGKLILGIEEISRKGIAKLIGKLDVD